MLGGCRTSGQARRGIPLLRGRPTARGHAYRRKAARIPTRTGGIPRFPDWTSRPPLELDSLNRRKICTLPGVASSTEKSAPCAESVPSASDVPRFVLSTRTHWSPPGAPGPQALLQPPRQPRQTRLAASLNTPPPSIMEIIDYRNRTMYFSRAVGLPPLCLPRRFRGRSR